MKNNVMKCSNEFSSIPTPLEVLNEEAFLFVNSIFYREKVLGQVSADNYRSFIAAVAVVTKKHFERTTTRPAKKQQKLASDLLQIFKEVGVKLDIQSRNLLVDCSSQLYPTPEVLRAFNRNFFAFRNWMDYLYN